MKTNVYIGYDPRDDKAWRVAEQSLTARASIDIRVYPVKEWVCRRHGYARGYMVTPSGQMIDSKDGKPFSTGFSFTRFMVPHLAGYAEERCIFMDADMLVRGDVAELLDLCTGDKAVWCVQHRHSPVETVKMDGVVQEHYPRKNWSSLVVWNPAKNKFLTPERINELPGSYLHAFCWLRDEDIGALPEEWNWLEGYSSKSIDPKIVHFTRGTPDYEGYENAAFANEWRSAWTMRGPSELERTMWS